MSPSTKEDVYNMDFGADPVRALSALYLLKRLVDFRPNFTRSEDKINSPLPHGSGELTKFQLL